jgi:large-conductance mechanosensitive channel
MYDILNDLLPYYISDAIYQIGHYFPQFIIGFVIIAFGLFLIRGKKNDLDSEEKNRLLQDKGGVL